MKKLLLIRHGETEINQTGNIHKANDSAKSTALGRKQAQEAANLCKREHVTKICTSPEIRAQQTATIVAHYLQEDIHILDDLRERNWGEWSQFSWEQIKSRLEKMSFQERYTFSPPGGESWKDMEQRLQQAIELIKGEQGDSVAVITHGGAIRALLPILLNRKREESFQIDPGNGEVLIFSFNGSSFILQ